MQLFHLLSLLWITTLATAQLNTLPQCVQTCLHNTIPSCSGLKCYCTTFTSALLLAASTCYHSTCDSTTPIPYQVLVADIGPLCSKENAPIDHAELNKAALAASSSSFSTYISYSDAPNGAATNTVPMTAPASPSGTPATQSVTFEFNTRNRLGEPMRTATSKGDAVGVRVEAREGWVMGMGLMVAGWMLGAVG